MPWMTPDSEPAETQPIVLEVPDHETWLAAVRGALFDLARQENWEQFGTLTPEETANRYLEMWEEMLMPFNVVGAIVMWPVNSAPNRWLICDGSAVNRASYPALFALIGTTYGPGDGSLTFNLPDLRAKFPVGRKSDNTRFDNLGETGGQETQDHTHTLNNGTTRTSLAGTAANVGSGWDSAASTGVAKTYSGAGALSFRDIVKTMDTVQVTTLPPYVVLNFIICATAQ